MASGAGLRALHRYLDVPVALVHAAALEVRLAGVYGAAREALEASRRIDADTEQLASKPATKFKSRRRRDRDAGAGNGKGGGGAEGLRMSHHCAGADAEALSSSSSSDSDGSLAARGPYFFAATEEVDTREDDDDGAGPRERPPAPAISAAYADAAAALADGPNAVAARYEEVPDADAAAVGPPQKGGRGRGSPRRVSNGANHRVSNASLSSHDEALGRLDAAVREAVAAGDAAGRPLDAFFGPEEEGESGAAEEDNGQVDDAETTAAAAAVGEGALPGAAVAGRRHHVRAAARPVQP
jgi:hypothetical protein